jgi:hypothetical protein
MGGNRSVRQIIDNLIEEKTSPDTVFFIDATVNSVDQDNRVCNCTAIGGKASNTFPNCRLMTDVDDGILILPTVGSNVTLILSSFTDPYVVGYTEVDQIIFRGGDLGGLVKVEDTVTKLNNLEKGYNNLLNKVNDLINKYNIHTHLLALTSGTGTAAATLTTETPDTDPQLVQTVRGDIENTAITQG